MVRNARELEEQYGVRIRDVDAAQVSTADGLVQWLRQVWSVSVCPQVAQKWLRSGGQCLCPLGWLNSTQEGDFQNKKAKKEPIDPKLPLKGVA